ncbi:MAG: hypothetical protein EA377_06705 [Phycisphaerales bacterium]|nr:MAG: hypothetical protein EA377_06705 [Phycisphaerales bacterium]
MIHRHVWPDPAPVCLLCCRSLMRRFFQQERWWVAIYIAAVLSPLALVLITPSPPSRGFLVEFAMGLGFVGLAMLGLQFALTARFRSIGGRLGLDTMLQFHRQAGIIAALFVFGHVVVALASEPAYFVFLDPRDNFARAGALSLVIVLIPLLLVLTFYRERIGLPYEWWRLSHGIIGALILVIGLAHVIRVDYLIGTPAKRAVIGVLVVGAIALLIHTRLVRPWLARRRPWRVADVRRETPRIWTLTLQSDSEHGLRFLPGQCVWLTIDESPFSFQQHPFTISSTAAESIQSPPVRTFEVTIKELGDFTRQIGKVKPGSRAFVEGPYGTSVMDPEAKSPAVFIVGGIGVTPAICMLRTLRDLQRQRPLLLLYATRTVDGAAFENELACMKNEMDLNVVRLVEEPPDGWTGESGRFSAEILERVVKPPFDRDDTQYFICGPDSMMDLAELTLRDRGVSAVQIHSERFQIV